MSRVKSYKDKQLQLAVEYFPIEGCRPWELFIKVDTGEEEGIEFNYTGTSKDLTQAQILDYIKGCLDTSWEATYGVC